MAKELVCETDTTLQLRAEFKNYRSCTTTPPYASWHELGQLLPLPLTELLKKSSVLKLHFFLYISVHKWNIRALYVF